MNFRTKFVQDLCATNTETYEELLQLVFHEESFLQNVRNLQKPALEALVCALLMKQRGNLPDSLLNADGFKLPSIVSLIHDNFPRLQEDSDTIRWIARALTLTALIEPDRQIVRREVESFVDRFERDLHEIPLYYEVLCTFLALAVEDPALIPSCSRLDGERMVRRLASEWPMAARTNVLTCLQSLLKFNAELYEQWLSLAQNPQQPIGSKVFLLCQLLETALRCGDDRQADIQRTLQLDHVWPIVIEGLAARDAVCRSDALIFLRHAIDYAKRLNPEADLNGQYFTWSNRSNFSAEKSEMLVTLVNDLSQPEYKLTLPIYDLIWFNLPFLHDAWKHLLLRLILGHANEQVVNDGLQYFKQYRKFNATEKDLEKAFLAAFNGPLVERIRVPGTIAKLREYYKTRGAYAFLLDTIPEIAWESVPYYCIASAVYHCTRELADEYKRSQQATAAIESLTNCIKVSDGVKNPSLRYGAFVWLVKSIVLLSEPSTDVETLLAVNAEIEKFAKMFAITLDEFRVEDGSTFFSQVEDRALVPHFGSISPADTFFIEQVLAKGASKLIGYSLPDAQFQSNLSVGLKILPFLPCSPYHMHTIIPIISSTLDSIERAEAAGERFPPDAFTIRQLLIDLKQADAKFREDGVRFEGLNNLLNHLGRLASARLDSIDCANQASAIETIRLAHLIAWHDKTVATKFFDTVSLEDLMDSLERHRPEESSSIDQVYIMIAEIYLNYRQHLRQWDEMYGEGEEWSELLILLGIDNIHVLTLVVEILHVDAKKVDPEECHSCQQKLHMYQCCYEKIMDYRHSDLFMELLTKFVEMLFLPYILCTPQDVEDDDVMISGSVDKYVYQLLEQSNTIGGLANIVFHCIARLPVGLFSIYGRTFLLDGMMFGDVPSRYSKLEMEVIKHNGGMHIPFIKQHEKELCQVRVLCVLCLYRFFDQNLSKNDNFLQDVEQPLMKRFMLEPNEYYVKYPEKKTVSPRQKIWILQALCIVVSLTDNPPDTLLPVMLHETNPPSVQHLLELLVADSSIETATIAKSLQSEQLTPSGAQSLIFLLWWRCCRDKTVSKEYIGLIKRWTNSNDFTTSLCAQLTIRKLLERFQRTKHEEFKQLYETLGNIHQQKYMQPHVNRFTQDIRFKLDCKRLVTLENVFHNIPRAAGVPLEDIVTTGMLKDCLQTHGGLREDDLGKAFNNPKLVQQMREPFYGGHEPVVGLKVGGVGGRSQNSGRRRPRK